MNISFITTVRHNVGDDFVREGIIYLLSRRWPNVPLIIQNIHKHTPVTVRKGFEWVRSGRISQLLDHLPTLGKDKIATADLVVLAGTPAYWCHDKVSHCGISEWFHALITKRYLRERTPVPFLILGVGTCQRYFSDGSEFERCEYCPGYIRQIHGLATVATVRDALAKSVLNHLGLDAPLLPCPSIFVREQFKIEPVTADYVCFNYMHGGGHYDFQQNIDADRWRTTFERFYTRIARQHRCVLVCHNKAEIEEARRIAPQGELFYSTDYRDYIRLYSGARCGIVNRVHAAFAIASFGRPSFVVGADTRAHMVDEIGLRHAFVNDVTLDALLEEFDRLDAGASKYGDIIAAVKQRASKGYVDVLESAWVLAQSVASAPGCRGDIMLLVSELLTMQRIRSIAHNVVTRNYRAAIYRTAIRWRYAGNPVRQNYGSPAKSLLLIRTDGIGDFVLFTPMLKQLRAIYRDYKISLILNEQLMNLAETCPHVDEIIPLNVKKYSRNLLYRLNFIRRLRARAFDATIYPAYSREQLADEILYCSGAAERIGFDGDFSNMVRSLKTQNDWYYTRLIRSRHTMGGELERNQEFVEDLFGGKISESDFAPELWLTQEDRSFVSGLLEEAGLDSSRDLIVMLFPGSLQSFKIWHPNYYARLADQLVERYGARMVICGGPRDIPVASAVAAQMKGDRTVLAGRTTLRQLAALLEVCSLYVGNDTGPLHIAVTIGIPTLCIMGGGQFRRFYPYSDLDKHRMVFKEMPCFHCDWHCIYDTTRCIQEISLDAVWNETQRLVEEIVLPSRNAFSAASQEQASPEQ